MNKQMCNMCNGQGRSQTIGTFPCNRCAGTGRECTPSVGLDPAFPCNYCRGSGRVTETRWEICRICNGTGRR